MKDQYAGDVNDFFKYAILCELGEPFWRLNVCWMLTPPDNRMDGRRTSYLNNPEKYRIINPAVFDALDHMITRNGRTLKTIQGSDIFRSARFFGDTTPSLPHARTKWFGDFRKTVESDELVFFDPDNGLEVPSCTVGQRNSNKYLYLAEVRDVLELGPRATCIYQHFPRVDRISYLERRLEQLNDLSPNHQSFAIYTSSVAFLVTASNNQRELIARGKNIVERASGMLQLFDPAM